MRPYFAVSALLIFLAAAAVGQTPDPEELVNDLLARPFAHELHKEGLEFGLTPVGVPGAPWALYLQGNTTFPLGDSSISIASPDGSASLAAGQPALIGRTYGPGEIHELIQFDALDEGFAQVFLSFEAHPTGAGINQDSRMNVYPATDRMEDYANDLVAGNGPADLDAFYLWGDRTVSIEPIAYTCCNVTDVDGTPFTNGVPSSFSPPSGDEVQEIVASLASAALVKTAGVALVRNVDVLPYERSPDYTDVNTTLNMLFLL